MVTKERKAELVAKFGGPEKSTGRTEVQVALLTEKIGNLTGHFTSHKKDFHSKRGLMKMIGQRRRLLRYLELKDAGRYQDLIKELGLRK